MLADAERLHTPWTRCSRRRAAREAGRRSRAPPVDMAALARECVELALLRHHLQPGGDRASSTQAPRSLVVGGDAEELRTVLTNLLDNAVKYSGQRRARDRVGGRAGARHRVGARAGPRRRHPEEAAEAHLQPLLPRAGARPEAGQGHRARPLHRAVHRPRARRPRVRAERRRGTRRHVHAWNSRALPATPTPWRCSPSPHEPHPDRRGRAAHRRRPALQPRGRGPRGGRRLRRRAARWNCCSGERRRSTSSSSTSCCPARTASQSPPSCAPPGSTCRF